MKKKTLLRNMALPAAAIFFIAASMLLYKNYYDETRWQGHLTRLNKHVANLTQAEQAYLNKVAEKIGAVDLHGLHQNRIVAELQSEILRENQILDGAHKYLWLSNAKGEFVFGLPESAFAKLNDAFDQLQEVIRQDGHYKDRNDFFMNLIQIHDRLVFNARATEGEQAEGRFYGGEVVDWRFYQEFNPYSYSETYVRPATFVLSAPVLDSAGGISGNLFLKVDDSNHGMNYWSRGSLNRNSVYKEWLPFLVFCTVVSGFFLWFLLPSWVYIDAQQRGASNPAVWAFLALISLVFGLAIYLITRPANLKTHACPKCEKELNGGAFCPHCGYDLSASYCAQCQYPIKTGWAYCPSCRAELGQRSTLDAGARALHQLEAVGEKESAHE